MLALAGQPSSIPMAEARDFTKDMVKTLFGMHLCLRRGDAKVDVEGVSQKLRVG